MGLQALIVPAGKVDQTQILTMLRLMQTYYVNVEAEQFEADLREKESVILLHEDGVIRGFSTWVLIHHDMRDRSVNVIFSGDTIIERDYWHSLALPLAWGHLMLSALAQHPEGKLYWLLTSKGYKTYRFLPVFFREFYPCFSRETPALEKDVLDSFASRKFGKRFDPSSGVLTALSTAQRLAPGIADINEMRRRDPHVAFFERRNPGYIRGDELVCLAGCCTDNLSPLILRYLRS